MYDPSKLSVASYGGGYTSWHYYTEDSLDEVLSDKSYFNKSNDMVRAGDTITAVMDRGKDDVSGVIFLVTRHDFSSVRVIPYAVADPRFHDGK